MADTWQETSKSGNFTENKDEYVVEIVGVMLDKDDTGYPAEGETDAGAAPTDSITDYIVQTVAIDPNQQAGRSFVRCIATKLKAP